MKKNGFNMQLNEFSQKNAGGKKNKAFAYRIYSHFTQQCLYKSHIHPNLAALKDEFIFKR